MTIQAPLQALQRLTHFYEAGYRNPLVDNALHKIIDHQIVRDETDLARVESHLRTFEQHYGMTSDTFWTRYQTGQLTDSADYMEWNAFCKMRQRLTQRLAILRDDIPNG